MWLIRRIIKVQQKNIFRTKAIVKNTDINLTANLIKLMAKKEFMYFVLCGMKVYVILS